MEDSLRQTLKYYTYYSCGGMQVATNGKTENDKLQWTWLEKVMASKEDTIPAPIGELVNATLLKPTMNTLQLWTEN
jgi:hypothetical protein